MSMKFENVFHFQEDYYNRLIKAETGMTYSAYLQKIRLEQSLYLLRTTAKSVEEIAADVWYHNKGFFISFFKKISDDFLRIPQADTKKMLLTST